MLTLEDMLIRRMGCRRLYVEAKRHSFTTSAVELLQGEITLPCALLARLPACLACIYAIGNSTLPPMLIMYVCG